MSPGYRAVASAARRDGSRDKHFKLDDRTTEPHSLSQALLDAMEVETTTRHPRVILRAGVKLAAVASAARRDGSRDAGSRSDA
jgi:hypothetical protein